MILTADLLRDLNAVFAQVLKYKGTITPELADRMRQFGIHQAF